METENNASYPSSYQYCPYCKEWYNTTYSSSDPNYKVHDCEYYKAREELDKKYIQEIGKLEEVVVL